MSIGSGLAVLGIWSVVAVVSFNDAKAAVVIGLMAMIITPVIACSGAGDKNNE